MVVFWPDACDFPVIVQLYHVLMAEFVFVAGAMFAFDCMDAVKFVETFVAGRIA